MRELLLLEVFLRGFNPKQALRNSNLARLSLMNAVQFIIGQSIPEQIPWPVDNYLLVVRGVQRIEKGVIVVLQVDYIAVLGLIGGYSQDVVRKV